MSLDKWPQEVPLPTDEEWTLANDRYRLTWRDDDFSDWGSGLEYVVNNYSILLWLPFFFPEEAANCRTEIHHRLKDGQN